MIRVPSPVKINVHDDQSNKQVIIISSPIRFGKGGRAKLANVARSHHAVIKGNSAWSPRAKTIVRL